ncbi:MAG: class I SAM-dependent methyltransferase [Oscillospiraceae bacterium]|jgi:tRNA (adenine22-N1)-methyltransferase|nr:class I SAM-dependent methyltransferase [Oscillospiraceae bacterium]
MKRPALSGRLAAVAGFVTRGAGVIDVGTDHGRVPVYLAVSGYPGRIYASDVNPRPLERARALARAHGVEGGITFLLGDGLSGVGAGDVDTVIISGMGGETMARILAGARRLGGVSLILQPQTKLAELCGWLDGNGYRVADAALAADAGRAYPVLLARPGRGGGARRDMFALCASKREAALPEYVKSLVAAAERAARGRARSSAAPEPETERELCFLKGILELYHGKGRRSQ